MRRRMFLGSAIVLSATALPRRVLADALDTALADVAKARAKIATLQGPFAQERAISLLASKVKSTGKMWLVRPDRLRWELDPPDAATYWVLPDGLAYQTKSGSGKVAKGAQGPLGGVLSDLLVLLGGDLASLKARYDGALAQGQRGSDDTFWIAYQFPLRPGLRINTWDNNVSISSTTSSDGIEWIPDDSTPQRVAMFFLFGKGDGELQKTRLINLSRNFRVHDRRVYWLGEPNAEESLILLARLMTDSPRRLSSSLAHYMTLHDSPNVADHLLQIARATSNPTEVRTSAITWLGREVSRKAGEDLNALTSDPNTQVQRQAVTAISRRSDDEAVPALIRIAKEHPNAAVRTEAIRLLGQKKDPRVLDFFEQLLKKK